MPTDPSLQVAMIEGSERDLGHIVAPYMEVRMRKILTNIARGLAGLVLFVSLNISLAEELSTVYNLVATILFLLVAWLWFRAENHRRRPTSYEPFNRG